MDRDRREGLRWGQFLTGVFLGLLIVAPVLAAPLDLPVVVNDETRVYLLMASGVLLFAALIMRLMRNRDSVKTDGGMPHGYATRFFPLDRPMPLE
jgi:hypothetical protein